MEGICIQRLDGGNGWARHYVSETLNGDVSRECRGVEDLGFETLEGRLKMEVVVYKENVLMGFGQRVEMEGGLGGWGGEQWEALTI